MKTSPFWKTPRDLTSFPRMTTVRQRLVSPSERRERVSLDDPRIRGKIQPGMEIAVGVGSRGITKLDRIVLEVVENLKRLEANPFLVPAMGSHGGATAEGQREILASYGITEDRMQVPIRATMEVVDLGHTPQQVPVYFDAIAAAADGIVVINRVKSHTDFRGDHESGLLKMLAIGLGKQRGAQAFHHHGFDQFAGLIPQVGQFLLEKLPILLGVAIVEDGYHEPALVEAVPCEAIFEREKELLLEAKRMLPRIPFPEIDVLIIGEMGKNISGCGMDPNVTGRFLTPPLSLQAPSPRVERIAALRLTPETHGNALGVGAADVITRRFYESIDYQKTYANAATAGEVAWARVPIAVETDRDAVALALGTAPRVQPKTARVVWIRNTLELEHLCVSEALLGQSDEVESREPLSPMAFDQEGSLTF